VENIMFTTQATCDEIYVFYNGELIYKKWKNTDQPSMLFDKYGPPTPLVDHDEEEGDAQTSQ